MSNVWWIVIYAVGAIITGIVMAVREDDPDPADLFATGVAAIFWPMVAMVAAVLGFFWLLGAGCNAVADRIRERKRWA